MRSLIGRDAAELRAARKILRARVATVLRDVRDGVRYGYPACCIVVFCGDVLLGLPAATQRALIPGMYPFDGEAWSRCVPCGVFHARPRSLTRLQAGISLWESSRAALRGGGGFWLRLADEARRTAAHVEIARLERSWWSEHCHDSPYDPVGQNDALDPELEWV